MNPPTGAGLYLYIPEFREEDLDLKQIAYLLLDQFLREYDVETRLGLIEVFPNDAPVELTRYPFRDLPVLFDQLVAKLEGRSGRPS